MRPLLLVAALTLVSCASSLDKDKVSCLEMGFEQGTASYSECQLRLQEARIQARGALLGGGFSNPGPYLR